MGCTFNPQYNWPTPAELAVQAGNGTIDLAGRTYAGICALPATIISGFGQLIQSTGESISSAKETASEKLNNASEGVKDYARTQVDSAAGAYKTATQPVFDSARAGYQATVNKINTATQFVTDNARAGAQSVVDGYNASTQYVADSARAGVQATVDGYNTATQFVADSARATADYAYDKYDVAYRGITNVDPNMVSVNVGIIVGSGIGSGVLACKAIGAYGKKDTQGAVLKGAGAVGLAGLGAYTVMTLVDQAWAIGRASQATEACQKALEVALANGGVLDFTRETAVAFS
ncbi:MAG: hypothetical protein KDK78_01390, partial [Chlamydiia bacterium]|nr:hypothetical protein [Chlamydiia bacterium]